MKKTYTTKPKFIEVENKNRTFISMLFPIHIKREDMVNKQLVNKFLATTNKNYPTLNSYSNKKSDLYIMSFSIKQCRFSNFILINPVFCIPKLDLIKEFDLDAAFKFIHDSLFNPVVNDDKFDEKIFKDEVEYLLNDEKNYPSSLYEYMQDQILDLYDDNYECALHYSEYIKYLNEATPKSTYDFYKRSIKDNNYLTYIYGNLDYKDKILNVFNKYFKQEEKTFEVEFDIYNYLPLKEYKEKRELTKYNQSGMGLIYQVKNLSYDDYFKAMMLDSFLGEKENNLIFYNLRTKYNLIYHSTVGSNPLYGVLCIEAFFNKKNEDKVYNAILEAFDSIKDEDNFNLYKSRLLKAMEYELYESLDNDFLDVSITINKETSYYYTIEDKINNLKKISYDEFMEFLSRITLTRKLLLVGEDND